MCFTMKDSCLPRQHEGLGSANAIHPLGLDLEDCLCALFKFIFISSEALREWEVTSILL